MINYSIIHDSIKFYETHGYKRIESPWTVTKAISDITKPNWTSDWTVKEKNKVLVASGEQSFLCLYNKGFLPKGRFQTVTPCFRDDQFDSLHTKYFIKNELIITDTPSELSLSDIIVSAKTFFEKYFGDDEVTIVNTGNNTYDLTYKDVELGSYGLRKCDYLHWIYGTGMAEPRLTRTMKKYGIS